MAWCRTDLSLPAQRSEVPVPAMESIRLLDHWRKVTMAGKEGKRQVSVKSSGDVEQTLFVLPPDWFPVADSCQRS